MNTNHKRLFKACDPAYLAECFAILLSIFLPFSSSAWLQYDELAQDQLSYPAQEQGQVLGASTILVPTGTDPLVNGRNFQAALDSAQCGDTIVLQAGATYQVAWAGSFTLKNKGVCTGTDADYITIQTSNLAGLPAEGQRVNPAIHAAAMPKLVAEQSGFPVVTTQPYAHHYKMIGLDFVSTSVPGKMTADIIRLDSSGSTSGGSPTYDELVNTHHFVIDRSFVHPSEISATNLTTGSLVVSATRGILAQGKDVWITNSYIAGFAGYYPGTTEKTPSYGIYSVAGPGPLHIINNYVEAWFNNIFTGGGDPTSANISVLASGATAFRAAFSNINNLNVGDYVGFKMRDNWLTGKVTGIDQATKMVSWEGVGPTGISQAFTADPATDILTYPPISYRWYINDGYPLQLKNIGGALPEGLSTDAIYYPRDITMDNAGVHLKLATVASGTPVDIISTGSGTNILAAIPPTPGEARWNGIVPKDVEVRGNTLYKQPSWSVNLAGGCKEFFEIKLADGLLVDGNITDGASCVGPGMTVRNQGGSAPWSVIKDVTITNNWFKGGNSVYVSLLDNEKTAFPGSNILVANNIWLNSPSYAAVETSGGSGVTVKHNTVRNPQSSSMVFALASGGVRLGQEWGQANFTFKDNITGYGNYGFNSRNGLAATWPPNGPVEEKNVVIDSKKIGFSNMIYIPNSYKVADDSGVGFADVAVCDSGSDYHGCALAANSPYKGKASDGTDPGVDMAAFEAAMAGNFSPNPITDTQAPTVPANLSATAVSSSQINLSWTASTDNVGVAGYNVYRNGTKIGTAASNNYNDNNNLLPSTSYTYTVSAYDAAGNTSAQSAAVIVTTLAPPDTAAPIITNISSSNLTQSSATISWITNEPADSQVEYGLTTAYDQSTVLDSSLITSHSVNLAGLSGSATYHFRVRSRDSAGNLAVSADNTFTTLGDTQAPVVSAISVSNISQSGAIITWITDEPADSQVEYGLTTAYGQSTALDNVLAVNHTVNLSSLNAATTYHYRVKSKDAALNQAVSADQAFATADVPAPQAPVISAVIASNVTSNSATITWITDVPATSQVFYGTSAASLTLSTPLDANLVTSHQVNLTGLSRKTVYYFKVQSKNAAGLISSSGVFKLTSKSQDPKPPRVRNVAASSGSIILKWNNPLDYEYYRGTLIYKGQGTAPTVGDKAALIADLTQETYKDEAVLPNQTYYYAFVTYDDQNNLSEPVTVTVTTNDKGKADQVKAADQGPTGQNLLEHPVSSFKTNALVNDNGTIYQIYKNQKVPFTSWNAFKGLGYNLKQVGNGDTSGYQLAPNYSLDSSTQAHPWGSWVASGKTVYYVSETDYVPVPSWDIFLANGGEPNMIVKANAVDLAAIKTNTSYLQPMIVNDGRVVR